MHLVLLGDSTLDNRPYTDGGPAVVDHVVAHLGEGSTASLLAVDGDMMQDVVRQLETLPSGATHLVLSVGGNDALAQIDVLARPATNVSAALSELADVLDEFEEGYRRCLSRVLAFSLPTVVCTIYNGAFEDPSEQRIISTTVRLFDDVIMQCGVDAGCSVVDLRRVCTEPTDYWDPIEPGVEGGRKIASAILSALESDRSSVAVVSPSGGGSGL
jgi:lysophospholipase L1-like esterase